MSTSDVVNYASAAISWACAIAAALILVKYTRRLRAATARADARAQEENALEKWAKWTMLTVTQRDGMVYADTILNLYRCRVGEKIWTDPLSCSLWVADPGLYDQWQREAEGMLRAALGEGPPEETDG